MLNSRKLDRTPLARDGRYSLLYGKCQQKQVLTAGHLFSRSELELAELIDADEWSARRAMECVARHVIPKPMTALQMLDQERVWQGMELTLDEGEKERLKQLEGGGELGMLPGITEIVAPAGAGKTQTCLTLCCAAFLPESLGGLGGGVLFIDTERTFSSNRIVNIAQNRFGSYYNSIDRLRALASNIHHVPTESPRQLLDTLMKCEDRLVEEGFKLLIVDGIALPGREIHSVSERTEWLGSVSSRLKYLSQKLNLIVVVTNQITTKWTKSMDVEGAARIESQIVAALGPVWAHAVNTRWQLESYPPHMPPPPPAASSVSVGLDEIENLRLLKVVKSPIYPIVSLPCVHRSSGVEIIRTNELSFVGPSVGGVLNQSMRSTHAMPMDARTNMNRSMSMQSHTHTQMQHQMSTSTQSRTSMDTSTH